ncbi:pyridoxamine 5'-phosphate oxidase family protein [Streptomyces meridianus]|uniref:Pyridoxamine 5'-phosphate oxidase family protein n=1 Tax=Streptomyces meridianus TaxID=2938945 RepID=A0ABT0X676_9ACTN|nr:pyridoxamine 5'-phosphate oxidase family protein [Streptomyces meridianus]MCM2578036.1 pyridoxamine 5'-phosphate oxidase family protein [Streptomyces meridianus]
MHPEPTGAVEERALELLSATSHGRLSMSLRALPFSALARHAVSGDGVLLRLHRGHGYHHACDGNVVAYGADAVTLDGHGWAVQFVGTARLTHPAGHELELLGRAPVLADGAHYEPAYLRVEPRFATVHTLGGGLPAQRDGSRPDA